MKFTYGPIPAKNTKASKIGFPNVATKKPKLPEDGLKVEFVGKGKCEHCDEFGALFRVTRPNPARN